MALVRVYCGLASAEQAAPPAGAGGWLTAAVVDDAGRLLDVCEVTDDPAGYARLCTVLAERSGGPTAVAIAADSDDHQLTMLLGAAGRALAITDDDAADDYAERFADDESADEMESPPAERRAVGLARALQAGAISAGSLPIPRDLTGLKGVLVAHAALTTGRHSAAVALREVLRELHPAALRAYPDPAEPVPLAVLDALPEPAQISGGSSGRGRESAATDAVVGELAKAGIADAATLKEAITALQVAIAETPRRGAANKNLNAAVAETIRQAVAAVRACDAACEALVTTLNERVTAPAPPRTRAARRAATTATPSPSTPVAEPASQASTPRRARSQPAGGNSPVTPQPLTPPPVAPEPVNPPLAPAAAGRRTPVPSTSEPLPPLPSRVAASASSPVPRSPGGPPALVSPPAWVTGTGSNRPVSAPPPPPPGITPIVPNQRAGLPPVESGEPFRPTLTAAAMNSVRAARAGVDPRSRSDAPRPDRTPPTDVTEERDFGLQSRVGRHGEERPEPIPRYSATDYTVPVPTPRPEAVPPGSRANWPLVGSPADDSALAAAPPADRDPVYPFRPPAELDRPSDVDLPAAKLSIPSELDAPDPDRVSPLAKGRVTPPWQADDLPPEPPTLRLVEPPPLADRALRDDLAASIDRTGDLAPAALASPGDLPLEPPPLRLVDTGAAERDSAANGRRSLPRRTPTESTAAPASDESDGDLLIFAEAKSAWFVGHGADEPDWSSIADDGWRAAEQAARPAVGAATSAGLPKRVPQANLVPGSPFRDLEEPLRIVRDPSSIAAHTSGYFRGWRRGQEINGYAVGGRPGRGSTGGWDFSRDLGDRDDEEEYGYRSAGRR